MGLSHLRNSTVHYSIYASVAEGRSWCGGEGLEGTFYSRDWKLARIDLGGVRVCTRVREYMSLVSCGTIFRRELQKERREGESTWALSFAPIFAVPA